MNFKRNQKAKGMPLPLVKENLFRNVLNFKAGKRKRSDFPTRTCICVLCLLTMECLAVALQMKKASRLLRSLGKNVLRKVEAVCMDMAACYREAVVVLPKVATVFDRFHVNGYVNEAWRMSGRTRRRTPISLIAVDAGLNRSIGVTIA